MRGWVACGLGMLAISAAYASDRPAIRSTSDLPPSKFVLAGPPSSAFLDDEFLARTLPALRSEAERVRARYNVVDTALEDQLRAGLAAIALLQQRPSDVVALVAEARAAASKPQDRAIGMLSIDAAAATALGGGSDCSAGATRIAALLAASDPAVVRDDALRWLTQIEVISSGFLAGSAEAEFDPSAAKRGSITLMEGLTLATWRAAATAIPACRAAYAAPIRTWAADPKTRPTDIWASREPVAKDLAGAKPIMVAVWDGGYDPALFGGQLAIDPAEPMNGRDDDGNGVADDWNGPTYGHRLEPMAAPLPLPSRELAPQLAFQMALMKGNGDLRYGYDTAEARLFATRSRDAGPADQALDALLWEEMSSRSHGTSVASEIADNAPHVRLYNVAALPFNEDPRPVPMDEAQISRWVRAIEAVGPRLRGAGVRVVNMSWGISADEIAQRLLRTGNETDQATAVVRGKAMFAQADAALRRLVRESTNILFVTAAGNSNQTDEIAATAPQSIVAPNLLVVGATGTNGRPTSFTTYGKGVPLYAWGEGVPLRAPGGMSMRQSGTSMAAPLVARAAASMLAINPRLTPTQLIGGLTATATTGEGGLKLLHSADAVRWAKAN